MTTNSLVTSNQWLKSATNYLNKSGIKSARLDALILLEDELKVSRIKLITDDKIDLTANNLNNLNKKLERRIKREPLAYINNKIHFYDRYFYINKHVLIPRPESEVFIEILKGLKIGEAKIADLGCGSGCLGITIKLLNKEKFNVSLIDISKSALNVAAQNANKLGADVKIINASVSNLKLDYDIIVANLPYVPTSMILEPELKYEPKLALYGGVNGLNVYRVLWDNLKNQKYKPKFVLTESLINQHEDMKFLANQFNYRLILSKNLIQVFTN